MRWFTPVMSALALVLAVSASSWATGPEFIFDQTNNAPQIGTSTVHDSTFTGDRGSVRSSATGNSVLGAEYPTGAGTLPSKITVNQLNKPDASQTATMTYHNNTITGNDFSVGAGATGNSIAGFVNPLR